MASERDKMRAVRGRTGGSVADTNDNLEVEEVDLENVAEIDEDAVVEIEEQIDEELDIEVDEDAISVDEVVEAEEDNDLAEEEFAPEDEEAPLDKILAERTGGAGLTLDGSVDGGDLDDGSVDMEAHPVTSDGVVAKREGEFTCTSCFLVKHPSQLADRKRMLCRDCV